MYTQRKSTHTLGNGDTTQQPALDSEGELAAAAAAPPPPPPLLLLLLLCCCCAAHAGDDFGTGTTVPLVT